ncbi:MAG TPA: DUF1653 domain-containing protein [Candidatus Saccharimonadales bacterium]|nr:DUF1653 domain-containing protein [Candidatus Saccharimonadales bacterium]
MSTIPTDHKPLSTLFEEMQAAASQVEIGALYGHYKNPQAPYKVTGFVILEATDEVAVLYEVQEAGAPRVTFARALSSWLEAIEWQGQTVPRFSKIQKTNE